LEISIHRKDVTRIARLDGVTDQHFKMSTCRVCPVATGYPGAETCAAEKNEILIDADQQHVLPRRRKRVTIVD
jgi:hypothetical protein